MICVQNKKKETKFIFLLENAYKIKIIEEKIGTAGEIIALEFIKILPPFKLFKDFFCHS